MKKVAVLYGSKINSKISCNFVNTQIQFIELIDNEHYFINIQKNINRTKKIIDNSLYKDIIDLNEYYTDANWLTSCEKLDEMQKLNSFTDLYIYGLPCINSSGSVWSSINKIENALSTKTNLNVLSNFNFVFTQIKIYFIAYYLASRHNVKITQFICDPLEVDFTEKFSDTKRYSFLSNTCNAEFLPYIDYGHLNQNLETQDKIYDMSFGMLDLTEFDTKGKRSKIVDDFIRIAKDISSINFYTKSKRHNIDTILKRNEYDEVISKSLFSYIAPSLDNNSFSFIRFCDIINCNTIPFIHPDCNVESAFSKNTGRDCYINIIKSFNLIKTPDEVAYFIQNTDEQSKKSYHNAVIDALKSCSHYINFTSNKLAIADIFNRKLS